MPKLNGKKYPYTKEGIEQYRKDTESLVEAFESYAQFSPWHIKHQAWGIPYFHMRNSAAREA